MGNMRKWAFAFVLVGAVLGVMLCFNEGSAPRADDALPASRPIVALDERTVPDVFCETQTPTVRQTAPYVVVSALPIDRSVRQRAEALGVRVLGYVPENALLVEADADAIRAVRSDGHFSAAREYRAEDKLEDGLVGDVSSERIKANIVLLNKADRKAMTQFVTDNGGRLITPSIRSEKSIFADIPRLLVVPLSQRGEVRWMERFLPLRVSNDLSVQPRCMNVTPVWDVHGLDGTGEVVAIADSGLDTGVVSTLRPDFADKIVRLVAFNEHGAKDTSGHGTHTAGSIAGFRLGWPYCGVAKGAKLYVEAGGTDTSGLRFECTYDELLFPDDARYTARIHSNSWGEQAEGAYKAECCEEVDRVVWEHPTLLVVAANGNWGGVGTVDAPASAKNVLAVGNSHSTRNGADPESLSISSSRGPCKDGRIKPDVAAPGADIMSTSSTLVPGATDYCLKSGTSMATPHVSGAAAIVRQWLRRDRGFDGEEPTAALMKAILTGGATGARRPDNDSGWGRVDLKETIFPSDGRDVFLRDRIPFAHDAGFCYEITTTNSAPLDVQLVWVDYPGTPGTERALVNDLDLSVVNSKNRWLGNGGNVKDDVNSVESVRFGSADPATYRIRIYGAAVRYGHDEGGAAAIYVRGAFDPTTVREVAFDPDDDRLPLPAEEIPHVRDDVAVTSPQRVDYAADCVQPMDFGNAIKRFVFAEGSDIVSERLIIGNEKDTVQHIEQTGGNVTLTGTGDAKSTASSPFFLGHWPGSDRSYDMKGGAFFARNGISRLGWDGGGALRIGGGESLARMCLKGIRSGYERSTGGSSLTVLPNGRLEVGSGGIDIGLGTIPMTLAGGTLSVYANASVNVKGGIVVSAPSAIDVPEGFTLTLDCALAGTAKVDKIGGGRLVLAEGAQKDRINLVEGVIVSSEWTPPFSVATVDVLVAYEAGAKDYVENVPHGTLWDFGENQVARMNAALNSTELDKCFRFRYVGCTNVAVACSDLDAVLEGVTDAQGPAAYAPIRAMREQVGADVVLVMAYSGASGKMGASYGLQAKESVSAHAEKAYAVVSVVAAVQQDAALREVGRLMGAGGPDAEGAHWKDYSHGHRLADRAGGTWKTIMCDAEGGESSVSIPFFSSPEYVYRGASVGSAEHDNTRALRESCVGVSQWRETRYEEPTKAEIAARRSPSRPVILFSAGMAERPKTTDDWLVHEMNDTKSYSVEKGGISISGSTSGLFRKNSNSKAIGSQAKYTDIYGRQWASVVEEMLVSLGLKGTREKDLDGFFKTGAFETNGSETLMTISGLDAAQRYVLYYMTCDSAKNSTFKLHPGGYAGVPSVDFVFYTLPGYIHQDDPTEKIDVEGPLPILVRVSNLQPNADGKVIVEVGGATVNVLALARTSFDPTMIYLARLPRF